jgi:phage gp37-like protein
MSALLLDAVIAHVRAAFTTAEVREVRPYAGEFSGTEVEQVSFNAPAILVTLLGWKPGGSERLTGRNVRVARLAAFVVTKNATGREARMREAMLLSERLCMVINAWVPDQPAALEIGPREDEAQAQNLYGRAVDAKGLALWLVEWRQACKPLLPPAQMWDLLAIDITDHTRQGTVPATIAPPGTLSVTEDVRFNPV